MTPGFLFSIPPEFIGRTDFTRIRRKRAENIIFFFPLHAIIWINNRLLRSLHGFIISVSVISRLFLGTRVMESVCFLGSFFWSKDEERQLIAMTGIIGGRI